MDNSFETLLEHSKQAIRYWWLLLLTGIALFIIGLVVFLYPAQSYLGMSLLFGWLMLISGILEVVLSSVNKHFITGRGWMLAGGIIEIVLGIILIFNVALSAATLPIFLGFWLMLRAFGAIGLGSDMGAMQIAGSGWTIFSGILLLLCSLWILFQPLVFGTTAVIVGSILYKTCIQAAMSMGVPANMMKLVTALLFLLVLVLSGRKGEEIIRA